MCMIRDSDWWRNRCKKYTMLLQQSLCSWPIKVFLLYVCSRNNSTLPDIIILSRLSFSFYLHFSTIMPPINFGWKKPWKYDSGVKEGKKRIDRDGNILSISKPRSQTNKSHQKINMIHSHFYQFNLILVYLIIIHQSHACVTRSRKA